MPRARRAAYQAEANHELSSRQSYPHGFFESTYSIHFIINKKTPRILAALTFTVSFPACISGRRFHPPHTLLEEGRFSDSPNRRGIAGLHRQGSLCKHLRRHTFHHL